ncbi:MAG: hypothetical protein ACO4CG_14960, partial [Prochlorothrix sp.]
MSNLSSGNLSAENQSRLEQLADTLDLMEGEPALILAVAPGRATQQRLRSALPQFCAAIGVATPIEFKAQAESEEIYGPLQAFLRAQGEKIEGGVAIVGLTELDTASLEAVLKDLNRSREQFRQSLALPLVIWVDDRVRQTMTRQINDFKTWTTTVVFGPEPEAQAEWVKAQGLKIQQGLEQGGEFQGNRDFLEPGDAEELGDGLDRGIEALAQGWQLPETAVMLLRFLQGRRAMALGEEEQALRCFQGCGDLWVGIAAAGTAERRWLGWLALHEAWIYRDREQWDRARERFDRAIEQLRESYGPEVWAKVLPQQWEAALALGEWETVAAAIGATQPIHQQLAETEGEGQWWPFLMLAQGALARVAQQRGHWTAAAAAAAVGVDLWRRGRALGQDQDLGRSIGDWRRWQAVRLALGQLWVEALERQGVGAEVREQVLRGSIEAVDPEQVPQFWGPEERRRRLRRQYGQQLVGLVTQLRGLLRSRGAHGEAFTWKQRQRRWELQFGLRAFMGAGQFQVVGAGMAAEALFAASGRGADVRELVEERLALDAYKCLTIYGPSGVGKSTLVEAGLVPALGRVKFPGGRRGVTVLVRFYEDWQGEVLRGLGVSPLTPLLKQGGFIKPVCRLRVF